MRGLLKDQPLEFEDAPGESLKNLLLHSEPEYYINISLAGIVYLIAVGNLIFAYFRRTIIHSGSLV